MARPKKDDWAQQVPEYRWKGPYENYGWERGQSGLPEFYDPEIHMTDREQRHRERMLRQEQRRGMRFANDRFVPWNKPGPYSGVGPKGYRRSDERISDDVCERLTQHGQIDAHDILVEVHDGEVTLKGTVRDRPMKRLAEDVADSVSGVQDVHNELSLRGPSGTGAGRRDVVGRTGVWPASDLDEAPGDAETRGMASWGQGERGAAGYQDSGSSELRIGPEDRK